MAAPPNRTEVLTEIDLEISGAINLAVAADFPTLVRLLRMAQLGAGRRSSATGRVLREPHRDFGAPLTVTAVSKRVIEPGLYRRQPRDRRSQARLGLLHSARDGTIRALTHSPARQRLDTPVQRRRLRIV
jgi:hypothetical protein